MKKWEKIQREKERKLNEKGGWLKKKNEEYSKLKSKQIKQGKGEKIKARIRRKQTKNRGAVES